MDRATHDWKFQFYRQHEKKNHCNLKKKRNINIDIARNRPTMYTLHMMNNKNKYGFMASGKI